MFEFINSTPAQLSPSQATRVRIRKQAMKKVAAARRRRGTYGKHNLRQLPNFLHPTQSSSPEDQEHSQSKHLQMDRRGLRDLDPPSLLQADYSHLIVSAHFSILNICPLASLHLGLAKVSHFTSDPVHMRDIFIFPYGGNSLLSFVPSRYGQTPSLTYAADCVVERLRGIVDSNRVPSGGPTVASRYVKALKCLQAALDDRELCMKPETLCATELLAVKLLDTQRGKSWIHHAGGAARLIEHRGPDRFNTDFEKALFVAQAGPIVTEALINGTPCFLAEEAWREVFRSAILPNDLWGERTELVMSLWGHLVSAPSMFKTAEELICSRHPVARGTVSSVIDRICHARAALLRWYTEHKVSLVPLDDTREADIFRCEPSIFSMSMVRRVQLLGTYLSCVILMSRLLIALAPARFSVLESGCQEMAEKVLRIGGQIEASNQPILCGLFVTQTWWVANATIQTRDEWMSSQRFLDGEVINRSTFENWCRAFGRSVAGKPNN
ncbi:uncharacterized protein Z520_00903 [Fonsecaea multimorphosa CBS 102226]|uniref:Transcription factor domain-containing protein n=1 Tax=Fonsecaea multimorphosa CBS 102226 TaxID=1442371 RepID=A0A0D2KL41_9EURO|nr:uncharacterized protein Z520_00903 [Fonsecaea multimorphosa CBS 102226]KIY04210.1 hypothetical protein Z520_00903 [Fonsecaea multimorphosa CBS 102226]